MQAEIRLAESGHSFHYSQLTTVHLLMHEIKKDFKIQLEDQKIIMKSGEILKSSMSFDTIQELMKKTISTNLASQANPSSLSSLKIQQTKQIQCLYVYNQKQLLKPIELKNFNQEAYLKTLRQKCKQMATLAQNSYEFKQFNQKSSQKNINSILESLNKRLKTPLQNVAQRYGRFLDNLDQRKYSKFQVSSILDLIQNQDKARKLLIRNVQYLFDRKTKKRFTAVGQKIANELQRQSESNLKQNSSFFSSNKASFCSEALSDLTRAFKQIDQKYTKFYEKLKQSKKSITKQRFLDEERVTFRVDKKLTSIQNEYKQYIKLYKQYFQDFCEQLVRVNVLLTKSKQKEAKDIFKSLFAIHEKISFLQKKIEDNIKDFTQMYLDLSKIHMKGETQNVKIVFEIYVELIKLYEELDTDIRKLQKQFQTYKEERNQEIKVSQFNQNRNINMPLKKSVRSPKKDDKKMQKEDNPVSKQVESNLPKINSPIKNKIHKNNSKNFNDEITWKNFQQAIKDNKQLARRLEFNKRLEGLVKYCSNMCEKEQQFRRSFRSSKEYEQNKLELLGAYNVPSIEIDYNESSDIQLSHLYKKWLKQNSMSLQTLMNWENEVIECVNNVSKTLTTYLASKSNATERERNIQKILAVLVETFYKMMKNKLQKQAESIKVQIKEEIENQRRQMFNNLLKNNQQLTSKLKKLQQNNLRKKQNKQQEIKQLEIQNLNLKQQIKNLEEKILSYQEEVKQTTQKLIESYEQSNAEEVLKLTTQLNTEREVNSSLVKEAKDLKSQLQKAKKNLIRQVQTCETLCKQIQELSGEKEFYQKQFSELKNMLADKEVQIIKLQKQMQRIKLYSGQKDQKGQNLCQEENAHTCDCQQQVTVLRQDKQSLQQQIQNLDRELKQILFKETEDQETQTEGQIDNINAKQNPNLMSQDNEVTSKNLNEKFRQNLKNQLQTKQANIHNFELSSAANFQSEHQAVSKYYFSSIAQQFSTAFPSFMPLTIGKSIEEGMCHVFLPFSNDIYVGVTAAEDTKNYTCYQEYLKENQTANRSGKLVYILDLNEFNYKTKEILRQCSLVLVVKVHRKEELNGDNKVMVSGKIEYALGFEDEQMQIKNYSHFLQE